MKLAAHLTRRISSFPSKFPFRNVSGITWYSTETLGSKRNSQEKSLYRRISPVGNPNESVVPVLDQWVEEGRPADGRQLRTISKELRHYRRHKHALEISQWMTDKRYMSFSPSDVAVRLDLIARVHGTEQAENYFNNIPKQLRTLEVYGALLNCYSHGKCIEKAETVMQKMRDFGFAKSTLTYNVLLSLYSQTGNREKMEILINEMEKKQIKFDRFTYSILSNTYGADSDIDGMEKILTQLESDPDFDIDWNIYAVVANQYLKAGLVEKAMEALGKSEKLIAFSDKKKEAFCYILTLYAETGNKEEVLRAWKKCKGYKVVNRHYMCMIPSILKFNDIETAEKLFEEWEASDLNKDIRIPNFLIGAYCKEGLLEKAEALLEKAEKSKWEKPNLFTWSWMSKLYVQKNQMAKAVEALKSALVEYRPIGTWKPDKETLAACLKHLKEEGDVDRSGELVRLLQEKGIISEEVYSRLLAYVAGKNDVGDLLDGNGGLDGEGEYVEAQN